LDFLSSEKEEMMKQRIDENAFLYPMPMVVVGTMVDDHPNFMAVGWVTRVNFNPPMIAVALGRTHYTNRGIHATGAFSVNIPGIDLLAKVDYCGLVSGKDENKASLFRVAFGEGTGAPMIEECPVSMECKVIQVVELVTNELFIGEIVGAYADDGCITEGKPDIRKIKPFTLTMPDNLYWLVGDEAGKAWDAGKKLKG
jgi:flavin reductase (DIM6/NTAB) family NADH-FMN oxidoreductase RutF